MDDRGMLSILTRHLFGQCRLWLMKKSIIVCKLVVVPIFFFFFCRWALCWRKIFWSYAGFCIEILMRCG